LTDAPFDGRALARLAKEAGAKYITLTSRHHDGFSLYDSAFTIRAGFANGT